MEDKGATKGNKNKIYFLGVVIFALVGLNIYLFVRNKQHEQRVTTTVTEKNQLQLEVEKIEVELDRVQALNLTLNKRLFEEQQNAREKLEELKIALEKGAITKIELDQAYLQVDRLKFFVRNINIQVKQLQSDTSALISARDSLRNKVKVITNSVASLKTENLSLNEKVKEAARLKLNTVDVVAFKSRSNGRKVEVTRSSTAESFGIRFTILPNTLAEKRHYNILLRAFDPAGNLIADNGNRFEADGQEMQFSHSIYIDFNNDNSTYLVDWKNPQEFIKGVYTIILYTEGKSFGKKEITIR